MYAFLNVLNAHKRQQGSGKFRLRKLLFYDKRAVENATSSFSVCSFFQLQHDFCEILFEKPPFFNVNLRTSSKVLQCHKILGCGKI